jgi:CheY-like chemotaxis protein
LYFDVPEKLVQKNSQNNESILLVEDDLVSITISSNILQKAGYKVVVVSNGQEALEILDQENFDLILMDGEMPVMSGYDATKKIREGSFFKKFKNYKTIPIIAFMASSDQAVIKKALESGMSDHAEKSISKDQLLNKISKYL